MIIPSTFIIRSIAAEIPASNPQARKIAERIEKNINVHVIGRDKIRDSFIITKF